MVRRLFLTPTSLPSTTVNRCLVIPDSREWLGIFNAALLQTAQAYNYEQVEDTDLTPEAVAALCYAIYEQWLLGECEMACTSVVGCIYPAGRQQRMNATTGRLEVSDDGGATWVEDTSQDPRFVAPRNEQTTGYTCDDAKAIVGYVQSLQESLLDQMDVANVAIGLIATLVGVLATVFSFGLAAPISLAFATVLVGTTRLAIEAALTTEVWERLLCNIFCVIDGASEITEGMYDSIMAQLMADESGLAYTVLWHSLNQLGPVGLHNAVALATPAVDLPEDCEDCSCGEWCQVWDFTQGQEGWSAVTDGMGQPLAQYQSGQYWWSRYNVSGSGNSSLAIQHAAANLATVTRIEAELYIGAGGLHEERLQLEYVSGPRVATESFEWYDTPGQSIEIGSGSIARYDLDQVGADVFLAVRTLRLTGTGINPFGPDNC